MIRVVVSVNTIELFSVDDINAYIQGEHDRAFEIFGAHFCELDGEKGCRFAVWALRAKRVQLVGDFNDWNSEKTPMYPLSDTGVFFVFVPEVQRYAHYKYLITSDTGEVLEKADPYAFFAQQPMNNASRVTSLEYEWGDKEHMKTRSKENLLSEPMNIYEVHMGSWKRKENGDTYTYRELAEPLLDYVCEMGYTHIELMPITEYPLDDSWGYQVTGYYAPTSKYGEPQDFMYFIDTCHQRGISVILDWVPSHFPKDAFALARFDGHPLYEYADSRIGEHKQWGTLVFDYGKKPVVNFLISNAVFWAEKYHIDGFRVDAVSSIIYLDYMREEFFKNIYGGNENLEALEFLKRLNITMNQKFPEIVMIAEEATDWNGITKSVKEGGLGFDFKWNMGWMNDTLRYIMRNPLQRKYHHDELTFSLMYAFKENYILPLSHDEVVHSEFSMIGKMPGDYWQQFANLRLLYGYMYTHPGKKLMFMGNEFAQFIEWKYYDELEWFMLEYDPHKKMHRYVKELNHFYKENSPLWENEGGWDGFEWLNPNDNEKSIISYVRYDMKKENHLVVICNFTPTAYEDYRVGVPVEGKYIELLNSDRDEYGGSGVTNNVVFDTQGIPWDGKEQSMAFRLPPLSCVILGQEAKNKNIKD